MDDDWGYPYFRNHPMCSKHVPNMFRISGPRNPGFPTNLPGPPLASAMLAPSPARAMAIVPEPKVRIREFRWIHQAEGGLSMLDTRHWISPKTLTKVWMRLLKVKNVWMASSHVTVAKNAVAFSLVAGCLSINSRRHADQCYGYVHEYPCWAWIVYGVS